MGWGMPFFGLFPLLVLVALIVGGVLFARSLRRPQGSGRSPPASALDILNARYARGEIARAEYLQARADIGAPPAPGAPPMSYYFAKTLAAGFDEAVRRTVEALKAEGFGVITEIDVKNTFKAKLGIDFRNYRILGACNPTLAHEALLIEDKVGAMLPCNVVVQDRGAGETEVAAIDPVASMQAIDNPKLKVAAEQVRERLRRVIDRL